MKEKLIDRLRRVVRTAGIFRDTYGERWQDRAFTGHISIGPLTVHGANAMHFAANLRTPWGYLCARPTTRSFGGRHPWYVYLSPNGTPWARRWGFGPGLAGE